MYHNDSYVEEATPHNPDRRVSSWLGVPAAGVTDVNIGPVATERHRPVVYVGTSEWFALRDDEPRGRPQSNLPQLVRDLLFAFRPVRPTGMNHDRVLLLPEHLEE